MNPKISIAIPVYNVEDKIERCINSVLSQSFQNFEIVIVNDETPDKSMDIVFAIAQNDNRIKIVNHPHNSGLMCARRTGYLNATGDYVTFLDSDDELAENALMSLYNEAIRSNADIVAGNICYITKDNVNKSLYCSTLKYGNDRISAIKSTLLWEMTHNLCGKLFKRTLFENSSYYTVEHFTIGEDGLLFYQLLEKVSKVSTINNYVYLYYQNPTSSTQVKYTNKQLESVFLFLGYRYNLLCKYKEIKNELNYSTMVKICGLCGSGFSRKTVNDKLKEYNIPIRLNLLSIICTFPIQEMVKRIIQVYCLSFIKA